MMQVEWSNRYCDGAWLITGFDEVAQALADPRFTVRRGARWINSGLGKAYPDSPAQRRFKRLFSRSVLFMDGRAHRRLRGTLDHGFRPGDLHQQRHVIQSLATQLIHAIKTDPSAPQGFDFITRFARPLPAMVIAHLMGLPERVPDAFIRWAADLATFIGSPVPDTTQTLAAQVATEELCDFFSEVINHDHDLPPDSLLARIILANQEHRLNQTEMLAQCATLLFAGYETTRNLLSNGLLALLQHPDQWAALKADPTLLRPAVREMLRYDSPVQYTGRRLLADVTMGGQHMRRGDLAILHIGQANHDARRFHAPQHFNIRREEGMHLSFGRGPHVCLGAALTQMEAEIAFTALMQHLPMLALPHAPEAQPTWQQNAAYRALASLPLIIRDNAHA